MSVGPARSVEGLAGVGAHRPWKLKTRKGYADHAGGRGANSRWSSASRDTRVIAQLVAARKPPDRRAPPCLHPGGMRDSWRRPRCVSTTPAGVAFSIVTVPVVFAPPRFSRRTPVSREALDHRLILPHGLRRGSCPRSLRRWTLISGDVYLGFRRTGANRRGNGYRS